MLTFRRHVFTRLTVNHTFSHQHEGIAQLLSSQLTLKFKNNIF